MHIEHYLSSWSGDQRIAYDRFSPSLRVEVNRYFSEACIELLPLLDNHDNRRLIAARMMDRLRRSEPTGAIIKAAALLALAEVKGRHETKV